MCVTVRYVTESLDVVLISQLGSAAQKYQQAAQNETIDSALPELQNNCNMFVASARQLAKALEILLVNDLGYTKRYVQCLQSQRLLGSLDKLRVGAGTFIYACRFVLMGTCTL